MDARKLIIVALVILLFIAGCKKGSEKADVSDKASSQSTKKVERIFSPGCDDSDGGITPKKEGFVNGTYDDGVQFEQRDSCVGPFLVEYFCLENVPVNKNIKCENCKEGACLDK